MIRTINKIISFSTTENNKCFCLSIDNNNQNYSREMYYADIEDVNSVLCDDYNKGCLRLNSEENSEQKIYQSIYNSKDLYLKSAIFANNLENELPNTYNFQNIFNYRLSDDVITSQIQVGNYIYQLVSSSIYGKTYYTQDIYSELSLNNGYSRMPNSIISTIIYNRKNLSTAILQDNVDLCSNEIIKDINTSVEYNQFIEIPGVVKNDYDSGNYLANVFQTKNNFNCEYDMSHEKDFENDYFLKNARKYIAIDHCNDQIYLKYYDNIHYKFDDDNEFKKIEDKNKYDQRMQRIEVLKNLNRFENINTHRTNYYDIDLVCEKLFDSFNKELKNKSSNDKINLVKNNLKLEIANCIQDICKNITPIDTQLININVLENEHNL